VIAPHASVTSPPMSDDCLHVATASLCVNVPLPQSVAPEGGLGPRGPASGVTGVSGGASLDVATSVDASPKVASVDEPSGEASWPVPGAGDEQEATRSTANKHRMRALGAPESAVIHVPMKVLSRLALRPRRIRAARGIGGHDARHTKKRVTVFDDHAQIASGVQRKRGSHDRAWQRRRPRTTA
jgi:hypothetical protein